VGFPQKLQGSARHTEVSLDDIFIGITPHFSRPQDCASAHLPLYLQLCCPFISAASAAD